MSTRHHWYEALRERAVRNEPVQVTPLARARDGANDSELAATAQPCQSRLLAVGDDESVMLELPPVPEQAQALRRAAALDVLAITGGQRWIGRCPVLGEVRHQLNERTGVLAMQLGPAEKIHSGQRRGFFRAETLGVLMNPVRLTAVERSKDGSRVPLKAQMLNLSGGGMGLRLDMLRPEDAGLVPGGMYQCQFQLPDDDQPISVQAHLIHARPTRDRALYLGLAFHFASQIEQRRIQDQIVQFATALERKRLQRRRGA